MSLLIPSKKNINEDEETTTTRLLTNQMNFPLLLNLRKHWNTSLKY